MKALYVDEAGCLGALPSSTSNIQPVFAFLAIAFDISCLSELTRNFLSLKRRFFPKLYTSLHPLDDILVEIKGADIRRNAAKGTRRYRRAAFGFLDNIFRLIEKFEAKIFGRLWIKGIGKPFNPRSIYTSSMQSTCSTFQTFLTSNNEQGFIVADSRNKRANTNVSHSIFTGKFRQTGDKYPNIVEMPVFGHSDNHAGIQIADLLCSAVVFPMAVQTYCKGHITSVHTRDYGHLKIRYGTKLRNLQFRYRDPTNNRLKGGITVSDPIGHRGGGALFR